MFVQRERQVDIEEEIGKISTNTPCILGFEESIREASDFKLLLTLSAHVQRKLLLS